MAHHFNSDALNLLKSVPERISLMSFRPHNIRNGWSRSLLLRHLATSSGHFVYHDIYRTSTEDLEFFPIFNLGKGLHTIYPQAATEGGISSHSQDLVRDMFRRNLSRDLTSGIGTTLSNIYRELPMLCENWALQVAIQTLYTRFRGLAGHPAEEFLKAIDSIVDSSIMIPERYYTVVEQSPRKGTYYDIHSTLGNDGASTITLHTFKNGVIGAGFGILVDFERQKVLGMIALNSEFMEYFTLCKLHGEIINPEILTVLVDEEFASKDNGYAKELYKVFSKGVLDILPEGIEQKYVNGSELFAKLFADKYDFHGNSLGPIEQIELNASIQDQMLEGRNAQLSLQAGNIRIVT